MFLNKTLLQLLTDKEQFRKLNELVLLDQFDKEERAILQALRKYWSEEHSSKLNMELFAAEFFAVKEYNEDEILVYKQVMQMMTEEPNAELAEGITRQLRLMSFNKELTEALNMYVQGGDIEIFDCVQGIVDEFKSDVKRNATDDFCRATVEDVITDEESGTRLDWKLDCLRGSMPGLRTGMQIIVAMRPGKGKTSFMADNGMHWLQSEFIRSTGRPVVWINNEGKGIRIKGNFIRAALGGDFNAIAQLGWARANEIFEEQLGSSDRLQIYDVHGRDYKYIERIIEKQRPAVVIWDMLDNVRGFTGSAGSDRADQRLEALYQWARECAVRYDFLSVPTSQVSVEGADIEWIPDSCLKDSKTGKQGACDAVVTIGSVSKIGFEDTRYIYIPKAFKGNVLPGHIASCRAEVFFDSGTSRFRNPKIV